MFPPPNCFGLRLSQMTVGKMGIKIAPTSLIDATSFSLSIL